MAIIEKRVLPIQAYLSNTDLTIPFFQRPYKWTVRNVIQLLDDIERFRGEFPYRIGTIVVYKEEKREASEGDTKYQIVDGQQRTITFLLIVKAIMAELYEKIASPVLKQELQQLTAVMFQPEFGSQLTRQNIRSNYREIARRIAGVDEQYLSFFLKQCEVTYFVLDDISEAFQFFDSQNARGKDLEPHDLLKAFHLREMHADKSYVPEQDVERLVADWEGMSISDLSALFADFMYRVRGWSGGSSSRHFTKSHVRMFKGVNMEEGPQYPYVKLYRLATDRIKADPQADFPFQLDQLIINGRYFFEMVSYYHKLRERHYPKPESLDERASEIIRTLDNYDGRSRTGDKNVRMLFDCALLFYIDKFGEQQLSEAVKKIFIWAYTLRLRYQVLQLASVDNYVVQNVNMFRRIKNAIRHESITTMELPLLGEDHESPKTKDIKKLFQRMSYADVN